MATETFTDRFNRITAGLTLADIASVMGVTELAVRKIRDGRTKTIRFDRAMKLCRRTNSSPWDLAGERQPAGSATQEAQSRIGAELTEMGEQLLALTNRVAELARGSGNEALAAELQSRAQEHQPRRRSQTTEQPGRRPR